MANLDQAMSLADVCLKLAAATLTHLGFPFPSPACRGHTHIHTCICINITRQSTIYTIDLLFNAPECLPMSL